MENKVKNQLEPNFWLKKSLKEMNQAEWEALCDGCGKCCLEKVEDIDTGQVYTTAVSCRLLDTQTCQCTHYENRFKYMDDCIKIGPKNVYEITWLPKTCAYRLVKEGKDLFDWHPLKTGDRLSTLKSGNSAKNFAIHPALMEKELVEYILEDDQA
jgi:uncharacterized cysteine cluster protein YcgN (CxxCxxCC family)